MLLTAFVFLILLSVLVLIHELGHFLVAKKFGIKVEEFGWGFPPKIWGKKIGETEYTINALPFGGFVKLYGEDDAGGGRVGSAKVSGKNSQKNDSKRAFFSKPLWQKALVVVAGVVMNVLLAFAIFYAYFVISGFKSSVPILTDYKFTNTNQTNYNLNAEDKVVSFVLPESPAADLNMSLPVEIIAVNDQPTGSREAVINMVNEQAGSEIKITWRELMTGETKSGTATPRENPPETEGALGIAFFPVALVSYDSAVQKVFSGVTYSYDLLMYTIDVMSRIIGMAFEQGTPAPVGEAVSGPVGIFNAVGDILEFPNIKDRVLNLLNLAGIMSISLAFFNILPIPALDGGRLFFILFEMITRKKVNPKVESLVHAIGFAILMGLIILIVFSDILKTLR